MKSLDKLLPEKEPTMSFQARVPIALFEEAKKAKIKSKRTWDELQVAALKWMIKEINKK